MARVEEPDSRNKAQSDNGLCSTHDPSLRQDWQALSQVHSGGAPCLDVALERQQIFSDVGRFLVADFAILLQRLGNDLLYLWRKLGDELSDRSWCVMKNGIGNNAGGTA